MLAKLALPVRRVVRGGAAVNLCRSGARARSLVGAGATVAVGPRQRAVPSTPPPPSLSLGPGCTRGLANHYDALGVDRDASLEEIKEAWLKLARETHPDRNPSGEAAARFRRGQEAQEVLGDPEAKTKYDGTLAAPPRPTQSTPVRESIAEHRLRVLVEEGKPEVAIAEWASGSGGLKLLIHLIEACRKKGHFPEDVTGLLAQLHAAERAPAGEGVSAAEAVSNRREVQLFVERKTRAYNDLIRLADSCGSRDQLFQVLDELEARKVPLDMDTWMVLEETFTVGMRRDNPKRGDVT